MATPSIPRPRYAIVGEALVALAILAATALIAIAVLR
jgi:hypothetical protein